VERASLTEVVAGLKEFPLDDEGLELELPDILLERSRKGLKSLKLGLYFED
jgi:hypothetical protein